MKFIFSTLALAAFVAVGIAEPTFVMSPPMDSETAAYLAAKLTKSETLWPGVASPIASMLANGKAEAGNVVTASKASSQDGKVSRLKKRGCGLCCWAGRP